MATQPAVNSNTKRPVATLRKRSEFLRLRSGNRHSCAFFTLQTKPAPNDKLRSMPIRVGYTVTTKVGNAVERNRIKRRLRAVVAEVFPLCARPQHDYVLISRRTVLHVPFPKLCQELERALDRVHGNGAKGGNKARGASGSPKTAAARKTTKTSKNDI